MIDVLIDWAKKRKKAEVDNRPKHNKHYVSLNNTWNQIIRKLEEVKVNKIPDNTKEAKLFDIIDHIDTAMDMFKPNNVPYTEYVSSKCIEAHNILYTDGYDLFYNKPNTKET